MEEDPALIFIMTLRINLDAYGALQGSLPQQTEYTLQRAERPFAISSVIPWMSERFLNPCASLKKELFHIFRRGSTRK